jgi:hypothetical protein
LGIFWELTKGQSNVITNGTKQWGLSQPVTVGLLWLLKNAGEELINGSRKRISAISLG